MFMFVSLQVRPSDSAHRTWRETKVNVKNTAASTFTGKKPSKPLQNTLFNALVSIICGGKPLITTNKLAGPVGKKGVLGGVYRLRNA